MLKNVAIAMSPADAANEGRMKQSISMACGAPVKHITGFTILKRSIDARSRVAKIMIQAQVYIDEPAQKRSSFEPQWMDVTNKPRVLIIGSGPAGLFAAIKLIELGMKPVIIERGKDVRARRRDLALINKEGIINPDSNYCFGEGGAGTYSDGKLYTRSTKRGNVNRILELFHYFGANEEILYDAHPHIGTNKLPQIITKMREQIIACGSEVHFEKKVVDFLIEKDSIIGVKTHDGDTISGEAVILATGHSARDIFSLLHHKKILIECKPFALGVRIEHPQALIDTAQYHCAQRGEFLPPASYSLVTQAYDRGVFSFCMCPGGIIAPAATSNGEIVVNGWSPSKRNNPFANSGTVVAVDEHDFAKYQFTGALAAMHYQQMVEQKAYRAGGGAQVAPAQRLVDFANDQVSANLPECSYLPGIISTSIKEVLPKEVSEALKKALVDFGKKMKGYFTNEAVMVATESRTSSPVRIPRNAQTLQHPQINGLYPCSEGAGYAGGIVSAAIDGERCAECAAIFINRNKGN